MKNFGKVTDLKTSFKCSFEFNSKRWDFQCVSVSDPQTDATLQGHTSAAVLKSVTELTGLKIKKKIKKLLIGAGNWTQERDRESRWEMMSWLFTMLFSFLSRLWRRVSLCALSHISDHPEHPYGDVMKEKTLDPCPLPPKPSSCPHSTWLTLTCAPSRGPEMNATPWREREGEKRPPEADPKDTALPLISVYSIAVCGTDSFSMDSLRPRRLEIVIHFVCVWERERWCVTVRPVIPANNVPYLCNSLSVYEECFFK